ncbi:MAG: hypothetical protein QHH26_12405 [Armatimonadota bacterium]|nr:hypothetical protein [Armatimonadota bacterium]
MNKRLSTAIVAMLTIALLMPGCAKYGKEKFARKVIDATYAGSFDPLRPKMTDMMKETMSDYSVGQVGKDLQQRYGKVKSLKLTATEKLNEGTEDEFEHETWDVKAERGSFDMKLIIDKKGRLAGVWFVPK